MISKPILFSGAMVRAILEGRKTQTRRIVKPRPDNWIRPFPDEAPEPYWNVGGFRLRSDATNPLRPKHPVGSEMWVRETHSVVALFCDHHEDHTSSAYRIEYRAGGERHIDYDGPRGGDTKYAQAYNRQRGEWRPSIFMHRWASRITLEVTEVRVQRLQHISEEDAMAEGCVRVREGCYVFRGTRSDLAGLGQGSAVMAYACLWDEINGADSWNANPWVWVYTFERVREMPDAR